MAIPESLTLYSTPVEEEPASDYQVFVNGRSVFTHRARVSAHPLNQVWPGYQRPREQTEIASFASWDMASPVEVTITSARPVRDVRLRPASYQIEPHVDGNTIRFRLEKPGQLTVEVNGTHHALHLFANPPETNPPDPKDPNVIYFGPGVHCPGPIYLKSNQTVYFDGGAVVYGCILAEDASNISILGRGILDGSKFDRFDTSNLIVLRRCQDVRIEGIIMRDPCTWTLIPINCRDVHIKNIKLIGLWRYNADGVDFVNSQHCSIEDSFVRSFDDSIVFKGLQRSQPEPVQDIQVRRCVLWNDWGRALEIGAETVAPEISDLLFEDCDIIHTTHIAMDIQNGDRGLCRRIVFKNIRVELDDDLTRPILQEQEGQVYEVDPQEQYTAPLIVLEIIDCMWSKDTVRGHIEDIHFEDIFVTADAMPASHLRGFDPDHIVQRVMVKNLRVNGSPVRSLEEGCFEMNEFVRDITLEA